MTPALILAVVGAVAWYQRRRAGRAGASAARRARQLRTPPVRLAELAGVRTAAGSLARRSDIGAAGERATARLLSPLRMQGWTVLHDRALPTGNANVDHLVISRSGVVFVVDSKKWSSRYRVRVVGGRLLHGTHDVTDRLDGLRHEAATVSQVLGCPVVMVVAMHGAPVEYGELLFDGIRILPADRVPAVLRGIGRRRGATGPHPARRAATLLPPHGRN
jgi:nuclease-like protein